MTTPIIANAPQPQATDSVWFLAGQFTPSEPIRHILIHVTPFVVGRRSDANLCIPSQTVSSRHAEIIDHGDSLLIRDLQSTNGTYLNGKRIEGDAVIEPNDLVQFADVTFRARRQAVNRNDRTLQEDVCDHALALVQFDKLMSERSVVPFYQPIVDLANGQVMGYEVLGRSRLVGLETPQAMFRAAGQLNLEVELSRMFRWEGIQASSSFAEVPHLFVNTHPAELDRPGLLESMRSNRGIHPDQPLTLEIHEAAVTSATMMRELRDALDDLGIGLAYDDFGAGQTRLVELVEVQPDYLKFDIELIRNIHRASPQRQQMLATLVRMVCELGVVPLAEGVECEGEDETCRQLGFKLGQGYFYGKPAPARRWSGPEA